jgi:hypothetical protein
VAATTTTTIRGVSLLTGQLERRRAGDTFDLALSLDGIEIRRPGQASQHLPWSRVSRWEIEGHDAYCLLTLRGAGATTPLVIPGWTLDDLEILMREVTSGSGGVPRAAPVVDDTAVPPVAPPAPLAPVEARARKRQGRRPSWKAVTTVVLLGVPAAAVTLVLLQSAGVIDWAFLGPTA